MNSCNEKLKFIQLELEKRASKKKRLFSNHFLKLGLANMAKEIFLSA
jgi:hypothetical protein